MNAVRISIVTATVGRREEMLRKLEALRAQTLPAGEFEWLVCENGGDGTLLQELERQPREFGLRTVHLPHNLGPGAGRNAAARLARGDTLYLSDDDCIPDTDTLERHLAAQRQPCVAIGAIDFRTADGASSSWRPGRVDFWNLNGANTSLPAVDFAAVGGFDERLRGYGGEDVLLGYRLHERGLGFRAVAGAPVTHLGPDPTLGFDREKVASAGRNAAIIAASYPQLRVRFGVHPLLLRAKLALLPPLAPLLGGRVRGEIEYSRAAWQVLREGASASNRPERREATEGVSAPDLPERREETGGDG